MTTETVLTDEQIQWIGSGARLSEYGGALAFARAIERAVLQSPEMQQRMEAYDTARVCEALQALADMRAYLMKCPPNPDDPTGAEWGRIMDVSGAIVNRQSFNACIARSKQ